MQGDPRVPPRRSRVIRGQPRGSPDHPPVERARRRVQPLPFPVNRPVTRTWPGRGGSGPGCDSFPPPPGVANIGWQTRSGGLCSQVRLGQKHPQQGADLPGYPRRRDFLASRNSSCLGSSSTSGNAGKSPGDTPRNDAMDSWSASNQLSTAWTAIRKHISSAGAGRCPAIRPDAQGASPSKSRKTSQGARRAAWL
jgi:hypothetical protein